ncbi:MAG: cytochrome c oxidase accessory protein CcoG, partial [Myxococcota bacterium]|nr:cytochrome c oxidase accessory protein CcoG [Myxococcota bacterium]
MNAIEPRLEELAEAKPGRAAGAEVSLYERWRKIYPAWVTGGFQTWRRIVLLVLVGVFYLTPWITWNGRPAVLLDIPARKFWFFSVTFWPQEFVLLSWLLIIAAFSLFFV